VVLSNGPLLSNKSGSIKERTQTSTEMGSNQSAVRSLYCHDLTADSSLLISVPSLPSNRQHLSYDVCLEVRGEIIRTVLLYCVLKLRTVINTLRRAVLTVLWIGFCHTGPISLCVDLFVFVCICVFYFLLHSCCIIVSTVGWTWWDWSQILCTYLPSVLWRCWLGHLTRKNPSPIWPIKCLVGR